MKRLLAAIGRWFLAVYYSAAKKRAARITMRMLREAILEQDQHESEHVAAYHRDLRHRRVAHLVRLELRARGIRASEHRLRALLRDLDRADP